MKGVDTVGYWEARAEYADGTEVCKNIPYIPGSIRQDNEEQYRIECELIEEIGNSHGGCTWYSVNYAEED